MANMTFGVNIIPKANTSVTLGNSDNPWEIVSPDLTGTPTAPTATAGTSTTQIATTAFVQTASSDKADKTGTVLETTLSRGRKANTTVGTGSFAFGSDVEASGSYSYAEGAGSIARGSGSHAEGGNTIASSAFSHAEGYGTISIYDCCHTFGQLNRPIYSGRSYSTFNEWDENSHDYSVGNYVKYTDSNTSNVMGYICIKSHTSSSSTAPYLNSLTSSNYWASLSTIDAPAIEVVGYGVLNGLDSERKNVRTLTTNGDEKLKGTLYVNCNDDSSGGKSIVDLIYPVGSIYMSVNNTSPATLFGGTWQQIQDTFLLAAGNTYTAGDTGGSASVTYTPTGGNAAVTLTTNQIPSHNHSFTGSAVTSGNNSVDHTHNYTDYYATTTGGTSITTAQLASHDHGQYVTKADSSGSAGREDMKSLTTSKAYSQGTDTSSAGSGTAHTHSGANTYTTRTSVKQSANHTHSVTASGSIGNAGGGQSHNHTFTGNQATIATMPPYLTVYMWQRTA